MKKTLFLATLLAVLMLSCTSNEDLQFVDESSIPSKVEIITYNYQSENYSLKYDISDEENTILLDGKDNETLSKIYEDHDELATVYVNETTYSLFDNMEAYEKSALYTENENKAAAYKEIIEANRNLTANANTKSISATLPDRGTNFDSEAYFYRRSQLRFNDGGYYINADGFIHAAFVPDFRYLNNSTSLYGGWGGTLFPLSAFNAGGPVNHNDAISSMYVNLMKVTIYEHQNYGGRSQIFDARSSSYNRIRIKRLRDYTFSCGFLCSTSWNDKISSIIYEN